MTIPLRLAAVAAMSALAGLAFGTVFAGNAHVLPVLGAAALPVAVVGGLRARPRWLRVVAAGGALAVYVLLAVAPGAAVLDGPERLLTGAVPLDPRGPELATVVVVVALAALGGAELALRPTTLAPIVPPLLVLMVALAVGASGPAMSPWIPAGFVAAAGALLLATTAAAVAARAVALRLAPRVAPRVALIAVAAGVALTVGPGLPGASLRAEPFDARDLVAQPVTPKSGISPLVEFPALLTDPERPLFTATADAPVGLFRLVALDRFDGRFWSTSASYRRAGRSLPPGPDVSVPLATSRAAVSLDPDAGLGWLPVPAPGRASAVSASGLGIDADSGDLVVPAGVPAPASYDLTMRVPRYGDGPALAEAVRAVPSAAPSYDPPPEIGAAARAATASADTAFGQLAALQSYFRKTGGFSYDEGGDAPAGHGLYQVTRLLRERHGTAEQYASAFAVLARTLDFDARVVVGFRPRYDAAARAYDVSTRDVHAWPEVRFEGLGWLPFEPSPLEQRTTAAGGQQAAAADPAVEEAVEREASPRRPAGVGAPRPSAAPAEGGGPGWAVLLATVVVAVVGGGVVAAAFVPAAKAVRRRRRRSAADPARRVMGAWREVVDRLTERGLPASRSMTRGEVVAAAGDRVAEHATLAELAQLTDAAGFARTGVTADQARGAWRASDRLQRRLRSGLPVRRRVRYAVDPRPLLPPR